MLSFYTVPSLQFVIIISVLSAPLTLLSCLSKRGISSQISGGVLYILTPCPMLGLTVKTESPQDFATIDWLLWYKYLVRPCRSRLVSFSFPLVATEQIGLLSRVSAWFPHSTWCCGASCVNHLCIFKAEARNAQKYSKTNRFYTFDKVLKGRVLLCLRPTRDGRDYR